MQRRLWLYPHGGIHHTLPVRRLDDENVRVIMKDLGGEQVEITLPVHVKDQRVLVAYDGFPIPGLLKHPQDRLCSVSVGTAVVDRAKFKVPEDSDLSPYDLRQFWRVRPGIVEVPITRNFFLFRGEHFLAVRLNNDSLALQGLGIHVTSGHGEKDEDSREKVDWIVYQG